MKLIFNVLTGLEGLSHLYWMAFHLGVWGEWDDMNHKNMLLLTNFLFPAIHVAWVTMLAVIISKLLDLGKNLPPAPPH